MKLLRGVQELSDFSRGTVATIGNFDGVHLGHQALLTKLQKQAQHMNLPMVVMLFDPQPSEFFHGQKAPARLASLREKVLLLQQYGVDYIYCLKFNEYLSLMSADNFAEHYLFSILQSKYLLLGQDFRFGRERRGDIALLQRLGKKHGCVAEEFPDFYIDEERVSSTKIRALLRVNHLEEAAKLLGRVYGMCGRVIAGNGLGRQWGIPTANLKLFHHQLPLKGVFCVSVKRSDQSNLIGVANIGCRPTINGSNNVLEIHLFDFDESLYGEVLQVFFDNKLRDEAKFPSIEALMAQIQADIAAAKLFYKQKQALAYELD